MSILKIKDSQGDWVEVQSIKGEKGDPFTYADFTPEQLESLKGKDGISPTVSVASDTSEDYRLSFTDETHTVTTPNLIPEAEKIFDVYPTDTASGSVASFPDGADGIPLKSCIVQIEPVQDLHGYDSPWPAGGGKNILPTMTNETESRNGVTFTRNANGSISMSGTITEAAPIVFVEFTLSAGNYTFSNIGSNASSANAYAVFYVRNLDAQETLAYINYNTPADNKNFTLTETTNVRFYTVVQAGATISGTVYPMIRLSSVTDATYAPYSNICPISGWTGCVISHSGADTSNPTTYPVTFPTEAGTIYGGYVDVTGGELVVDRAMVDLGMCNIAEYVDTNITNHLYYAILPYRLPRYANNGDPVYLKCSALKPMESTMAINYLKTLEPNTVAIRQTYTDRIYIKSEIDTVEAMKQSLDGVQLVYELATPIHYPITAIDIKTLLGQNNLWADTGDTEVEYRASTKMYIDRKITEAVAAALNS